MHVKQLRRDVRVIIFFLGAIRNNGVRNLDPAGVAQSNRMRVHKMLTHRFTYIDVYIHNTNVERMRESLGVNLLDMKWWQVRFV